MKNAPISLQKGIKISVIVPVYNVEQYLPMCIDSILAQTFTDFELLLIDDGSPDCCGTICDSYADRDPRIRVFHKENGGVSSARNMGLEHARGEWVVFVDADDTLFPDSFCKIGESLINNTLDLFLCNSFAENSIYNNLIERFPFPVDKSNKVYSGIEMFQFYSKGSVCGVGYSRQFLFDHSILFSTQMKNAEDTLFFTQCMVYAKSIAHFSIDLYKVNQREGSASRSWNLERILHMCTGLIEVKALLENIALNTQQKAMYRVFTYRIISNILYSFFNLEKLSGYSELRNRILSNQLLPISLQEVPCMRMKIRILNFSFDLFASLFFIRRVSRRLFV